MKTLHWNGREDPPFDLGPTALTMGVFDGFHRGHRTLIEKVVADKNLTSTVLTFHVNPKKILQKESYTGDLMTLQDKLAAFKAFGVDRAVIIDFSTEFSKMTGRDFFMRLSSRMEIRSMVVGYDFSFGKGASTKAGDLASLLRPDTTLSIMPPVYEGGRIISSTLIRNCIKEGKVGEAVGMMGHPYAVTLEKSPEPSGPGRWSAGRKDFLQILPDGGVFSVRTPRREEITLTVAGDSVTWEQEGPADGTFLFT